MPYPRTISLDSPHFIHTLLAVAHASHIMQYAFLTVFPRHLVLCKKEKVYRHYSSFILPDKEIDRDIDKMRVEPNGYYNWSVCLSSMKTSMQFYTSHFYLPLSRFCQYENIIKTKWTPPLASEVSHGDALVSEVNLKITYHFLGTVRGLYFLYFIFHSIISVHRLQHWVTWMSLIILVFVLVSCRLFLKAVEFWCFCAFFFLTFPLWELIVISWKSYPSLPVSRCEEWRKKKISDIFSAII